MVDGYDGDQAGSRPVGADPVVLVPVTDLEDVSHVPVVHVDPDVPRSSSSVVDVDPVVPSVASQVLPSTHARPSRSSRSTHNYATLATKGLVALSCSCVPASDGFPPFICQECDERSWTVVQARDSSTDDGLSPRTDPKVVQRKAKNQRKKMKRKIMVSSSSSQLKLDQHTALVAAAVEVDACAYRLDLDEAVLGQVLESIDRGRRVRFSDNVGTGENPVAYVSTLASSAELRPVASSINQEVPLYTALKVCDYQTLVLSTAKEVARQQSIGSLGVTVYKLQSDLPDGAASVQSMTIYKRKIDPESPPSMPRYKDSCRIAARGDDKKYRELTKDIETFSSTCSDEDNVFTLALMQAYAESRGEKVAIDFFDIGGAFCRVKRPPGSVRLFLQLPHNLPHPLAGCFLEVLAALYGLKESNRMFSLDVAATLVNDGFIQTLSSPSTYQMSDPLDDGKKIFVNVHVDDFRSIHNEASHLVDKLWACLKTRYSDVSKCISNVYCGVEHLILPNGGVQLTQDNYIKRLASKVGVGHMEPVLNPGFKGFFEPSSTPEDLALVDQTEYMRLTGSLVQTLKTRYDIKHLVSHVCSLNASHNEGDYKKAINILRHLSSTPGTGPVYKSSSTEMFIYSDSSFADQSDGTSGGADFQCIGEFGAPFSASAKAQSEVAPNPMAAEYMSAGHAIQNIKHFLRFGAELGIPQVGPVTMVLDCQTAINLIQAPEVTKKARYMNATHHFIREASSSNIISVKHVKSPLQRCDPITKVFPNALFRKGRDNLLNRKAILEQ